MRMFRLPTTPTGSQRGGELNAELQLEDGVTAGCISWALIDRGVSMLCWNCQPRELTFPEKQGGCWH